MATTGIVNSTLMGFYASGTKVVNVTSVNFKVSMETRETTNHDSAGWETSLGGKLSGSGSFEGWFAEDASYGFDDLFALITARTAITGMWSSAVSGDKKYSASVLITDLERSGGTEDNIKFTCNVKTTGAITEATI